MKVLKLFWNRAQNGSFGITAMQGLDLLGPERSGDDFFAIRDDIIITQSPPIGGTIKSVMGEASFPLSPMLRVRIH